MELIDEKDFNRELSKEYLIVDFFATWCGPCRMLAPTLEKVTDIDIIKVDVDKFPGIAQNYGVMSIPTLIIFKEGTVVAKRTGFASLDEINAWIAENKK